MSKILKQFFPFIIMWFITCTPPKDYNNWEGGMINKFGTYYLKNSNYVIQVLDSSNFLNYSVKDNTNDFIIKSKKDIGTFSKWSLYWDNSKSWLWVFSSDVGVFVWMPGENNKIYKQVSLIPADTALIKQIPKDFFAVFPDSFKRVYSK